MFGYLEGKLDKDFVERVRHSARLAGCSSPEEFIAHVPEKGLCRLEAAKSEEIKNRLRGLGYVS